MTADKYLKVMPQLHDMQTDAVGMCVMSEYLQGFTFPINKDNYI